MMLIYWFYFLLAINTLPIHGYTLCSKCASNYIVYHWENIHLKRNMRSLDEIAGDDGCLNVTSKTPTVRCNGQCALFSVIGSRNNQEYPFGVYRDCSAANSFDKLMQQIESDATSKVELELSAVRDFARKIVFELCDGYLCNGNYDQQQAISNKHAPSRLTKNTAQTLLPNFPVLVSTLFLYIVR